MSGFRRPYRPGMQQYEPALHTAADLDRMHEAPVSIDSRTLNWLNQGFESEDQYTYEEEVPQMARERLPLHSFRPPASRFAPLAHEHDAQARQPFQPVEQTRNYYQHEEHHAPHREYSTMPVSQRTAVTQPLRTQQAVYEHQEAPLPETRRFQPRSLNNASRPVIQQISQPRYPVQPVMRQQQAPIEQQHYNHAQAYEPDDEYFHDDELDAGTSLIIRTLRMLILPSYTKFARYAWSRTKQNL